MDGTNYEIGFHVAGSAWYAATALRDLRGGDTDYVMIVEGTHNVEFQITFGSFGAGREYCRVLVFDEAFALFDGLTPLKGFIASGACKSPAALKSFLEGLGCRDLTCTEPPESIATFRRSGLAKLSREEIDALGVGHLTTSGAGPGQATA